MLHRRDLVAVLTRARTTAGGAWWVLALCTPTVFFGLVNESCAALTALFRAASFTCPPQHHCDMISAFVRALATAAVAGWVFALCTPTAFFGFVTENCTALTALFRSADLTRPLG